MIEDNELDLDAVAELDEAGLPVEGDDVADDSPVIDPALADEDLV